MTVWAWFQGVWGGGGGYWTWVQGLLHAKKSFFQISSKFLLDFFPAILVSFEQFLIENSFFDGNHEVSKWPFEPDFKALGGYWT